MNKKKIKTMLVTGRCLQKKLDTFDLHLSMNGKNLEQVSSFKLLGLTFDDELSFDVHVEKLCTKLSQRIAVLSKIKRCLPHRERIIYYNAMIKSVILYGSTVWTVTSKENLNRVLKLQKRAARVILDMDTSARSVDMFKQLDWVPYYDEVKIFKATITYKRINSESPGYLTNMLKLNSSVNNRVARYSNLNSLCPEYKRKTEGGRTFTVTTIKQWNQLPRVIREKRTVASFKHNMKLFFKESYENIDHFII